MSGEKKMPGYMKFVLGGTAGMTASCFVQPFDVIKTRMQISGEGSGKKEFNNSFECAMSILKNDGIGGLYKGIGAGLLRQATYSTTRLGIYTYLTDMYKNKVGTPNLLASMGLAMFSGACGAFVGTPAEVALIRMMTDSKRPPAERRNYKNVFNALSRIIKEEGVFTLWRGSIPTVGRAMIVNMCQLASYSQFKLFFHNTMNMQEGIPLHFMSSMSSGFLTTITSMPLDIAKTRIQNMKIIDGKPEYTSMLDVIGKVIKSEGPLALWKGFTPYLLRLGPHTVLTLMILEQLVNSYNKYVLGIETGSGI